LPLLEGLRVEVYNVPQLKVDLTEHPPKMKDSQLEKINYREATVADCAAVARVHVTSWRASFKGIVPQSFLDNMSVEHRAKAFEMRFTTADYMMYVAEGEESGIIGFADFGASRDSIDGYEAELYAIYLLPEFQGRGIGAGLFRRGVKDLMKAGVSTLYLLALEVSPYRSFYEKMGGRIIAKRQKEIDGDVFDVLVYGWDRLG
jgi:GNAT superfamily N-acetyltransferase